MRKNHFNGAKVIQQQILVKILSHHAWSLSHFYSRLVRDDKRRHIIPVKSDRMKKKKKQPIPQSFSQM